MCEKRTWEKLEVGQIVEGVVTGMNKGGLELTVRICVQSCRRGSRFYSIKIEHFIGQKFKCEVTQFDAQAKESDSQPAKHSGTERKNQNSR